MQRALQIIGGVLFFVALNAALATALRAAGVRFPSSVAGMGVTFAALLGVSRIAPIRAARLTRAIAPAADFLGRWMALFFVPPLAVLPAADLPTGLTLGKLGLLMTVGFLFTLVTTALMAQGLIATPPTSEEGNAQHLKPSERSAAGEESALDGGYALPPVRLLAAWIVLAAVAFAAGRAGMPGAGYALLVAVTVALFLAGTVLRRQAEALLPDAVPPLLARGLLSTLHPVVLSAVGTALVIGAAAPSYAAYLGEGRALTTPGGLLMAFLGPAVAALGVLLYRERALLKTYGARVVLVLVAAALLSLLSSALMAWGLGLSAEAARAALPRSVTTPVAIPIAELLGADPGIAAAIVIVTGVLGAVLGQPLLDALDVRSPVARGLGVGASSHGIGTAALVGPEPSAAALSGISFALLAAFSALAVSVFPVRRFLLLLTG